MADDAYRQVLDALLVVVTGLPTTGANVFEDPTHAIAAGKIPSVAVEPVRDPAEPLSESHDEDWLERHELRVRFTVLATSPAVRDTAVLEVKQAVIPAAVGLRRRFVQTDFGKAGEGAKPYHAAQVDFDIEYHVLNTRPDTLI